MRYSLADYTLSITPPTSAQGFFQALEIGGNGEYVGSISIEYSENLYSIQSYATGAYVFDKNLSKAGTISISLNQLCEQVSALKTMVSVLFENDYDGFTIALRQRDTNTIASCIDCYPQKIPNQDLQATAQNQTWTFLSGNISML